VLNHHLKIEFLHCVLFLFLQQDRYLHRTNFQAK
jgi:hypothetical protein